MCDHLTPPIQLHNLGLRKNRHQWTRAPDQTEFFCQLWLYYEYTLLVTVLLLTSARMRSEGVTVLGRSVCLSVCLSLRLSLSVCVSSYSRTTGYEAAHERYQRLQNYASLKSI